MLSEKREVRTMLKNNKVNMILSLIIAVALWAFVTGEVDPSTTHRYTSIPVTITGLETLHYRGLDVRDPGDITADVTLSGKRSTLSKIDSSDIKVTADASEASEGKNELDLNISTPKDTKVSKTSPYVISVTVEERVSATKKVKVSYSGTGMDNAEPGDAETDPKSVTVTGARSSVARVDHVDAKIDLSKIKNSKISEEVTGVPVSSGGKEIGYLDLSDQKIKVTGTLEKTKKVSLNVKTTGSVSSRYEVASMNVPDTITIKGSEKKLEDIDSVSAKDVDISGVTKTVTIPLDLDLPDGISVADSSKDAGIRIVIEKSASKKVRIKGNVSLINAGDGLTASAADRIITVTVKGTVSEMNGLSSSDITLYADLKGLDAGSHKVSIKGKTGAGTITDISPSAITVTIKEK
jgi:YbbR domain-containing protein